MTEDFEDESCNPSIEPSIGVLMSRRALLGGAVAAAALPALPAAARAEGNGPSSFTFKEVPHVLDETHHVADGYDVQVLIRWGDPVLPGAPAFDPLKQTAASQALQFGYNNDFLGLHALPAGSTRGDRFLLVANHEYVNSNLMFEGVGEGREARLKATAEQVGVEMAAQGGSVLEIVRDGSTWKVVPDSKYARRIDTSTPMRIAGPASGHARMKTSADPAGTKVLGMINNCAGGSTPWGTWLTCEENFNFYFSGTADKHPDQPLARRYGLGRSVAYAWGRYIDRFDFDKEPNEPNRFGWVVEIDPYTPDAPPVKRTALGRFKHEGCTYALAKDGRVVLYSGDDERFDYVYRLVTARPWNPADRAANRETAVLTRTDSVLRQANGATIALNPGAIAVTSPLVGDASIIAGIPASVGFTILDAANRPAAGVAYTVEVRGDLALVGPATGTTSAGGPWRAGLANVGDGGDFRGFAEDQDGVFEFALVGLQFFGLGGGDDDLALPRQQPLCCDGLGREQ